MSVATRNPFALLNDDDVGEPVASTPSSTLAAPEPKSAPKDQKTRGGPASRGGRYYARGGAAKTAGKDSQETEGEAAPRESRKADGDGRTRGRGGRGGARARGAGGRGRQFDRHSGTLPDSDKKVSQGWGATEGTAELNAEQQGVADAANDATGEAKPSGDGWGDPSPVVEGADGKTDAANGTGEGRRNKEEEEVDNSLTFDEYLAQQKAKEEVTAVPKLEIRKANEGVDESLWKDTVPLAKDKTEDDYFVGKTKAAPKARAKKEEKVIIEIDARFERPARGGARGRGGRGSDRPERGGDRPRGGTRGRGGRGGRDSQPDVNVADQSAFPSLV